MYIYVKSIFALILLFAMKPFIKINCIYIDVVIHRDLKLFALFILKLVHADTANALK